MIYGITHTDKGQPITRLATYIKVAVGLGANEKAGRRAPQKLDFFIFQTKTNNGSGLTSEWEINAELTSHYGKSPRELEIILMDDDPENIFPSQLAWWGAASCKCWGNGLTATRRTDEHPEGQPWEPCGKECPDLEEKRCKPSGDLRFMLADFPRLGSVCRLHTTSYRSVMQIGSALEQIRTITGGRLAGIRCLLTVRPEKTSYQGSDGKRHSTIVPALSLEVKAAGMKQLVTNMVQTAHLFQETKRLLGAGNIQVIDEDETQRADEFSKEFYHDLPDDQPAKPKVNRQERERGTLEPGKSENRGHDATGFEQFSQGEKKEKSAAQSVGDMCAECRQTLDPKKEFGGHHKICPHRPKDAPVKETPTEQKPIPGAEVNHVAQAAGRELLSVKVEKVNPRMKRMGSKQLAENHAATAEQKDVPHEPKPYLEIVWDGDRLASVWDTNLHPAILKSVGKDCVFAITTGKKNYITVEDIVSIAGVKFARDPVTKQSIPADILAATERASENMAQGKTAGGDVIPLATGTLLEDTVISFTDKSPHGDPLTTTDERPYVYIMLMDTDEKMYCLKPHLFECLKSAFEQKIVLTYSNMKQSSGQAARLVEDVHKIDGRPYTDGNPA
jgi:hypothetical protein